ncbi:MAG: hypothetical protein R6X09_05770 [Bacteroidales bacterium]
MPDIADLNRISTTKRIADITLIMVIKISIRALTTDMRKNLGTRNGWNDRA